MRDIITFAELRSILNYDDKSGLFTWAVRKSRRAKIGTIAGTTRPNGYMYIGVNGRYYMAHRLGWLYVYGMWPDGEIDHINRIKTDNRIENLRIASREANMQNQMTSHKQKRNRLIGAYYKPATGRWSAVIGVSGKSIHLGYFANETDAYEAYMTAKRQHHPSAFAG